MRPPTHMDPFIPFSSTGYMSIDVLSFLIGRQWDEIALAYCHAVRPSSIRVTTGAVKSNARTWRLTVTVNAANVIQSLRQEVVVGLPEGIENGHALDCALHS